MIKKQAADKAAIIERERTQDELDAATAAYYGGILPDLANRRLFSTKKAAVFILMNVYRRLMLAVFIMGFYFWPIIQIVSALFLQLGYMIFLANYTVYSSPQLQRIEMFNE